VFWGGALAFLYASFVHSSIVIFLTDLNANQLEKLIAFIVHSTIFWAGMSLVIGLIAYKIFKYHQTASIFKTFLYFCFGAATVLVTSTIYLVTHFDLQSERIETLPLLRVQFIEPHITQSSIGDHYEHDAAYQVVFGIDEEHIRHITVEEFYAYQSLCDTQAVVSVLNQKGQISIGDGRVWTTSCHHKNFAMPVVFSSLNFKQASRLSIINQQDNIADIESLASALGLNETTYPLIRQGPFGVTEFAHVVNLSGLDITSVELERASKIMAQGALTGALSNTPFNPMLLLLSTTTPPKQVADALTLSWQAPKVIDVLTVINVDPITKQVLWVQSLAPTNDDVVLRNIENKLTSQRFIQGLFDVKQAAFTLINELIDEQGTLRFRLSI